MATRDYVANEAELPEWTLTELFVESVEKHGGKAGFRFFGPDGGLSDITFDEAQQTVMRVGAALETHGVTRGDRAAILAENRPEWALTDYGCLCAGVVDVPVYYTLTAAQVAYVLRDSGSKLIFTSTPEQMEKALAAAAQCSHEVQIVVFDPPAELPDGVMAWDTFLADGEARAASWSEEEFHKRARQAEPEDVATILYTSGTTGDPKGVMLTHNNVASNVLAAESVLPLLDDDVTVSFLPLSHILQRMVDYLFFHKGVTIGYAKDIRTVVDDMKIIHPTVLVSVPRIYEKIYNGVMDARGVKKRIIKWAVGVADRVADVRLGGGEPTGMLARKYKLADKLVFSKVKQAVGGRLRYFVSGGGPLEPALNRFFYSIGMTILEGYGLTETSPVTNVNTFEDFCIGTVGPPVAATEIRIAGDGEILIRGPQVMKGYYNQPEATAEVIDSDGWFASGDIGEIDEHGYLKITDRKKDIIVTAGGKNVAPQPLENRLKTDMLIEQAVLIGDKRKYISLLVAPAFDALEEWADENGVSCSGREELVSHPEVVKYFEDAVATCLSDCAPFETPKRVAVLADEFTIDNGFLTPTLKVKRRVIQDHFKDVIDGLYEDEAAHGVG
jgi:long-chain acyl-CoA synthetase